MSENRSEYQHKYYQMNREKRRAYFKEYYKKRKLKQQIAAYENEIAEEKKKEKKSIKSNRKKYYKSYYKKHKKEKRKYNKDYYAKTKKKGEMKMKYNGDKKELRDEVERYEKIKKSNKYLELTILIGGNPEMGPDGKEGIAPIVSTTAIGIGAKEIGCMYITLRNLIDEYENNYPIECIAAKKCMDIQNLGTISDMMKADD